jgi:RNA polymerase primary sigma factor
MSNRHAVGAGALNRLLRMAAVNGVENAVRLHVDRGDDINARDGNGLTPLMLAAGRNRSSVCRVLLEAGVDASLKSPAGQDALAIAKAAGAQDAVAVIEAALDVTSAPLGETTVLPTLNSFENVVFQRTYAQESPPVQEYSSLELTAPEGHSDSVVRLIETDPLLPAESGVLEANHFSFTIENVHFESDTPGSLDDFTQFERLIWEAEDERPPPVNDPALAVPAVAVHVHISSHEPVDSSADWDDLEFELPTGSAPFLRPEDAEARAELRLLFLRAVREGSVPSLLVKELTANDDGSENDEAEALLVRTINDLGAEVDERFEYATSFESFEVHVHPDESADEENAVSHGLTQIDVTASNRNAPLYIYLRELQRGRLISAPEEASLAKEMEAGLASALDALACWRGGIHHVITSASMVKVGVKPFQWISVASNAELPEMDDGLEGSAEMASGSVDDDDGSQTDDEADAEPSSSGNKTADFFKDIEGLSYLPIGNSLGDDAWILMRDALASLSLARGFLVELSDLAAKDESVAAHLFVQAIEAYQDARNRMVAANLRLVYSIAKKHLYSGIPLDDLIQEGNIGLLKAIERYDWRKGFKFSTYATWWIRQKISRFVAETCRTIRIPVHFHTVVQNFQRERAVLEKALDREPSIFELARHLGLGTHKVETLLRATIEPVSIDENSIDMLIAPDCIQEYAMPDPFDVVAEKELGKMLDAAVSGLDRKGEWIIRMRYGLGITEVLTLEEIGQRFNVTRERIRQIEAKALRKLQHPSRSDALRAWGSGKTEEERTTPADDPLPTEPPEIDDLRADVNIEDESDQSGMVLPQVPAISRSTAIDRLLLQSAALGIPVDDDRTGSSGKAWIKLTNVQDTPTRKLVRHLIAAGFEYLPGKGYWK